jgi:hypothetical protein
MIKNDLLKIKISKPTIKDKLITVDLLNSFICKPCMINVVSILKYFKRKVIFDKDPNETAERRCRLPYLIIDHPVGN